MFPQPRKNVALWLLSRDVRCLTNLYGGAVEPFRQTQWPVTLTTTALEIENSGRPPTAPTPQCVKTPRVVAGTLTIAGSCQHRNCEE